MYFSQRSPQTFFNPLTVSVWLKHLKNDLMKFWDKPAAYGFQDGLFPTYRSNSGERIDPDNLPDELKAALADENTAGLVETDYNFIRAHSRQTYACVINRFCLLVGGNILDKDRNMTVRTATVF